MSQTKFSVCGSFKRVILWGGWRGTIQLAVVDFVGSNPLKNFYVCSQLWGSYGTVVRNLKIEVTFFFVLASGLQARDGFDRWTFAMDLMAGNTKFELQLSKMLSPQKQSPVVISTSVSSNITLYYYILKFVSRRFVRHERFLLVMVVAV